MDIELQEKTPDFRGVADIRLVTMEDGPGRGQRLLIARNASGVSFEIAVDRGFDLSCVTVGGTNIGWHSSTQMPFPARDPGSEDGWGFLRNFDGFLATCGLDHYSRPHETDVAHLNHPHLKTIRMPLHGRISTEKARLVGYGVDIETGSVFCEGIVRQASVFGETLELRRRITVPVFENRLLINDIVTNRGFRPASHAIMYHLNFGYPFLDDDLTIEGLPDPLQSDVNAIPAVPSDTFGEKVDVVDNRVTPHATPVTLRNPRCGLAVSLDYDQQALPKLAIWRAYQSGVFALGIEPRTDLRPDFGGLLAPREQRQYSLQLRFASA